MRTKRLSKQTDTELEFVLSTPSIDRVGDRVMPEWSLEDFKQNPIALFGHMHDSIIGRWEDVRLEGKNLVGKLVLAKKGTSALVDEVRSLIEQGILKATSIGFSSGRVKTNDFGGYDLFKNSLHEVSIVAVPAQAEALRKSFSKLIPKERLDQLCSVGSCKAVDQTEDKKRVRSTIKTIQKGYKMKTLKQRIEELQEKLKTTKDTIKSIAENEESTDSDMETLEGLTAEVEEMDAKLKGFLAAEKAIATTVKEKVDEEKSVVTDVVKNRAKGELVSKLITAQAKAFVTSTTLEDVVKSDFGHDTEAIKFIKAATAPADTTTVGWAAELVEQGYGDFMEALYPNTVYGKVGGKALTFDRYGSLVVPSWKSTGKLAGDFVAEGAPIPVKQGEFQSRTLVPHKLGVITTMTREILTRSTPAIEGLLRSAILNDTAQALDAAFLSADAASAIRPAGISNPGFTGAANIKASTGSTVTEILADVKGIYTRLANSQLGNSGIWLMNPQTVFGLGTKHIATSQFAFPEVNSGSFAGQPIVQSTNIPADTVFFIDAEALVKANNIAPEFTVSNQATLVMADPASEIVDGAGTAGKPVRSMYQTDTVAIRFVLGVTWDKYRDNGIQILTGVSW